MVCLHFRNSKHIRNCRQNVSHLPSPREGSGEYWYSSYSQLLQVKSTLIARARGQSTATRAFECYFEMEFLLLCGEKIEFLLLCGEEFLLLRGEKWSFYYSVEKIKKYVNCLVASKFLRTYPRGHRRDNGRRYGT